MEDKEVHIEGVIGKSKESCKCGVKGKEWEAGVSQIRKFVFLEAYGELLMYLKPESRKTFSKSILRTVSRVN